MSCRCHAARALFHAIRGYAAATTVTVPALKPQRAEARARKYHFRAMATPPPRPRQETCYRFRLYASLIITMIQHITLS